MGHGDLLCGTMEDYASPHIPRPHALI